MSSGSALSRQYSNVAPMVCIRPRLGSPIWALISELLIALGLPPLSDCICASTKPSRLAGKCSIDSACSTTPVHCPTPAVPDILPPIQLAIPPTNEPTGPNPDCNPPRKPDIIACPAGCNRFLSRLIGPLCALIHPAILDTQLVTFFQMNVRPSQKP